MDSDDQESLKVHALLLTHKQRLGLVALSRDYSFSLSTKLLPSKNEPTVLRIEVNKTDPVFNRELPIESLTVLYGENGCGKTHAMIEACSALSSIEGERRLAVVWERAGKLYFDPGSFLKGKLLPVYEGSSVDVETLDEPLSVAFYTTSPFEASKRRFLGKKGVVDVTPIFTPSNPFEGSALLKAFSKLPTDFPFIPTATVRLQVRVPSLRSVLDRIVPQLKLRADRIVSDTQRRTLARLDQLLEAQDARAFAMCLLVISNESVDKSLDLLIRIAGESGLLDKHSKEVDDRTRDRFRRLVSRTLNEPLYESPQYLSSNFNTAHMLLNFLDVELPSLTSQLGRKTTLGKLSGEMAGLSRTGWKHLDQASRLGLTKWSFRDLSSGQVALLLLFSSLASAIEKLPARTATFIFIDEGEMFMHPAWQRRYISDLVSFLGQFGSVAPHVHLLLATHSLIVAADAPPNRLYDVDKGEMNNGFGYGPKDLLGNIYGVGEFLGEHASGLISAIADHIRGEGDFTSGTADALTLAKSIADERLSSYLVSELARRAHREENRGGKPR